MSHESIYPYQLADGSTRYYFKYRKSDGSPGTKRGFTSRREARRARLRVMAAVDRGEVRACRDTFAVYFDRWLVMRRPYLEEGTWRDYRVHGEKRLKPAFGAMKLGAVDEAVIRDWVAEQIADGRLAPKTINNSLKVLVGCLNAALDQGLIVRNPALRVQRLPQEHREMEYLRLYEIPRYLDACSPTYRPLAEVLIATGMRISEALALRWADVDFDRSVITVFRSEKAGGVGSTKGKRFRVVHIGPRLVELLRDLKARRGEARVDDSTEDLVFRGPLGGRLNRSDVSRDVHKQALEDAGLRTSLRLHDLRHTAAARWLTCGKPLVYVQQQLGHASITTTERHYKHLSSEYLGGAAAEIEALIWDASAAPMPASNRVPTDSHSPARAPGL